MSVYVSVSPFVELPAKGGGYFSIAISHIVAVGESSDGKAIVFAGGGSEGDAFYLSCSRIQALAMMSNTMQKNNLVPPR